MSDHLKVVRVEAFQLEWKGQKVSDVKFTRREIEEYRERWETRYRTETTRDLVAAAKASDPVWELRWKDSDGKHVRRVRTQYQKDAKALLREELDTQRLPSGYELEKVV